MDYSLLVGIHNMDLLIREKTGVRLSSVYKEVDCHFIIRVYWAVLRCGLPNPVINDCWFISVGFNCCWWWLRCCGGSTSQVSHHTQQKLLHRINGEHTTSSPDRSSWTNELPVSYTCISLPPPPLLLFSLFTFSLSFLPPLIPHFSISRFTATISLSLPPSQIILTVKGTFKVVSRETVCWSIWVSLTFSKATDSRRSWNTLWNLLLQME